MTHKLPLTTEVEPDTFLMLNKIGDMTGEDYGPGVTAGRLLDKILPILHEEYVIMLSKMKKREAGEESADG